MNHKKLLSLVMTMGIVASVVTGCSGKNAGASGAGADQKETASSGDVKNVSLKVWSPEEDIDLTQTMCDEFAKAHPEYNITWDISITNVDESCDALTTDADTAADVFIMPSGSVSQLVDAGLLYPITYDQENINAMYSENALDACSKDGILYGIPSTPNSWFMYYNKTMYTEDEVKSLDTMMAKDLGDGIANFSCTVANSWYIEAFFYGAGCTLYGADGTDPKDCTWNNADGVAAGEYLIDLVNNPKYLEDQDGIAGARMKEGTLAALCSGTWAYTELYEVLGDDLGAVALPTFTINGKEAQMSNFADYKCYAVKSGTKEPLAAQQLAEWFANEQNQLARYEANATTPTCLSLQDNEQINANVATAALLAQTAYAVPQPAISQINEYWTPVEAFGTGIVNKEITKDNLKDNLDTVVSSVTSSLTE